VDRTHGRRLIENTVDYIRIRQNSDGGYTFCLGAESNVQDTYYALATLNLLGATPYNIEKTVNWFSDFESYSIYNHYYINKTLLLCDEPVNYHSREFVASLIRSEIFLGEERSFEVSSEFELTLIVLELANMLNLEFDFEGAERWLLQAQNTDGGFGVRNHSAIDSTYQAVAALQQLNYDTENLRDTVEFLRGCEKPYGGFTVVPSSVTIYVEPTYYGLMTLDRLGEKSRFPSQTADFILDCQKGSGGFARSETGIATLQNTFQAVDALKKMDRLAMY
jgi:hypothetical protein